MTPFEIPDPAQAADAAAEFDTRCLENEEAHLQQWQAEAEAEAWGGREPSASYAEWVAEGRSRRPDHDGRNDGRSSGSDSPYSSCRDR